MDRPYELYENYFVAIKTGTVDVLMDFYDFLEISPNASENEISRRCQDKRDTLKRENISSNDYVTRINVLDTIESYLTYSSRNRQIYDERIAKRKKENEKLFNGNKKIIKLIRDKIIENDRIVAKQINLNKSNLKKKFIRILVGATVVTVLVGFCAPAVNNYKLNVPETSVSDYSLEENETYSDADVKMEIIDYLAEPGSGIGNENDIAEKLGISPEKCIQVGDLKLSDGGVVFTVKVPEDVAKKYNKEKEEADKLKPKDHFVCEYQTPDEFSSLIDVAYDIIAEYPAFKEGEEYTKNGRTPANYLALCMIKDNPNIATDFHHASAGVYTLNFYGNDDEYYKMIKEGKLPKPETKSIGQN